MCGPCPFAGRRRRSRGKLAPDRHSPTTAALVAEEPVRDRADLDLPERKPTQLRSVLPSATSASARRVEPARDRQQSLDLVLRFPLGLFQ